MALMDRIDCVSFLEMPYPDQLGLILKVRTIRSSALSAAQVASGRITKSAMRNIEKNKTSGKRKMMKDPTKAAKAALSKLTPEQIALITKQLQNNQSFNRPDGGTGRRKGLKIPRPLVVRVRFSLRAPFNYKEYS